MLELTTINTTELANKKLGAQLNAIKKAVDTGNNQQWKIADAIATIVDDELFIDDFETEGNLAKVLGMSRPNLNKMKKGITLSQRSRRTERLYFNKGYGITCYSTGKNRRIFGWVYDYTIKHL